MDYKDYYSELLRKRVDELRTAKGLSERGLSFQLGKSAGYIRHITAGDILPHLENLFEICEYFHITPSEFFDDKLDRITLMQNELADNLRKLDDEHTKKLNILIQEIGIDKIVSFIDTLYELTGKE